MELKQAVVIEQARYLHRNFPTALLGGLLVTALVLGVFWNVINQLYLCCWFGVVAALTLWRLLKWRRYRAIDFSPDTADRWLRNAQRGALLSGIVWGTGWLFIYPEHQLTYQLLFIYAITMMSISALFSYGVHYRTFLGFHLASMLPALIILVQWRTLQQAAMTFGMLLFGTVALRSVRSLNRMFMDSLQLRYENANLVAALTREKEAAESANLAKSRFLAAASHDLRQPMHALNLYLGAFAGIALPEAAQSLFIKVRQCAQTMDEMFRALLGISQLDAGAVQAEICDFELQPMLERIRIELEPQARDKGLELRLAKSSVSVRSDPELLERILRNLVSNAVRYTERGKILLGCRRRGEYIAVCVYDTGIGISSDKQRLVFEEFYQVDNHERDRNKGLGLGLAIVDRLAKLLSTSIKLQSIPNRGSIFSIELPRAQNAIKLQRSVSSAPISRRNFSETFIVVVDDEELILDAARVLLEQWGCHVITADCGSVALAHLSNSKRAPDILICDYRLRGTETGIDVIESLRSEFNTDIPALLLTGDTAPDRIQIIGDSGLPVLHKPLHEEELGEALSQLMEA